MSIVVEKTIRQLMERLLARENTCLRFQGKRLDVTKRKPVDGTIKQSGRGTITGLSRSARFRLLKFMACIKWENIGPSLFVTLTYPDEKCNVEQAERGRQRFLWWRHLEGFLRRHVSGIWRLEWKKRQSGEYTGWVVPHLHMMVFGVEYLHWTRVREWWAAVLHHSGPLATDVERIKDKEKVAVYIAKYMAKATEDASLDYSAYLNNSGRHYGFTRKSLIPLHEPQIELGIDEEDEAFLREFAAARLGWFDGRSDLSFTLIGEIAVEAKEALARFRLTRNGSPS